MKVWVKRTLLGLLGLGHLMALGFFVTNPGVLSWCLCVIPASVTVSILCLRSGAVGVKWEDLKRSERRPRRPRNPNAGRWLGAPVAELDKSTLGKLLASRASRDPSVHAVVRTSPDPVRADVLYDPDLDG